MLQALYRRRSGRRSARLRLRPVGAHEFGEATSVVESSVALHMMA